MSRRPVWAFKTGSHRQTALKPIKVGRNNILSYLCYVNHTGVELSLRSLEIFSIEFSNLFS